MLSSKDFENQLKLIPTFYLNYSFNPVEYGKGVYKGISAYSELRERYPHLVPTEKEFVEKFLQKTIPLFPMERLMTDYDRYRLGLEARAKRAYKSLVREEHAIIRMKELYEPHGFKVLYDHDDDWQKGIDVTIQDLDNMREHYVHLFVDTPWSRQNLKHKEKRGNGRDFSTHVFLPFKKGEGKMVGDFELYDDKTLIGFMYKLRTDYKRKGKPIN